MSTQHVSIPVFGFSCGGGGARTVERVLSRLPGAAEVYVNPATALAEVDFDPDRLTVADVCAGNSRSGFRPGKPIVDPAAGPMTGTGR